MSILSKQTDKTYCRTEYDTLKRVVLCEPKHMHIREQINDTQKHFANEGLHIELAMEQHQHFVKALEKHGVEVILLPPNSKYPEQVFTRDIGFTLGQTTFVAEMAHGARIGEENILKEWLESKEIPYYNLLGDMVEGGDVIINGHQIFIGLSNRTNQNAINHIQKLLHEYEVITVPFTEKYLHLDCVFNIISENEALYFPRAFDKKEEKILAKHFDLIEVNEEEQFTLGTNVLSIGKKRIVSLPINREVNQQLRIRGYEVIEVDITEIIKSGGSFRCCTMPLVRAKD
ncbi:dimethylarginine dimethylaminohydrolase family protein [Evansella cellulosilytica]|uniref:Amidinotransferase n=1 Tax=Evansella cellulosilytica (strain ATCC 21833 / DSM 2522 / FERM P-1141 / JCM 9156 / N-4) TaxID=649639 RepID=E6TWN8_EVAC2|nr:dimethylarginine dimethylaminohydrolase family protein [Evansella cellulosilytica]ADU28721.1 amidinotransferase [Evansella cellulosilytica DSM 2522]